jgi:CRISPR-associated protein Csm3
MLEEGLEYTEIKTENIIDRRTGVAARGGLRTMERIPAGTKFNLQISLRVFQGDDEINFPGGKTLKDFVSESLDMVQQDYLGGSGTRGYGWVKIENLKIEEQ